MIGDIIILVVNSSQMILNRLHHTICIWYLWSLRSTLTRNKLNVNQPSVWQYNWHLTCDMWYITGVWHLHTMKQLMRPLVILAFPVKSDLPYSKQPILSRFAKLSLPHTSTVITLNCHNLVLVLACIFALF